MVSPREQPLSPEELSSSGFSVQDIGLGWFRPKAELERLTGDPYEPFGRAVPASNRWSDSTL